MGREERTRSEIRRDSIVSRGISTNFRPASHLFRTRACSDDVEIRGFVRESEVGGVGVEIRPVNENDSIDLYRTIMRHRAELQTQDPSFGANVKSLISVARAVQTNIANFQEGRALPLVVIANGTLVGEVGFICIDWENSIGYIGYWLSPKAQGKGIMTEAVRGLIDMGFQDLNLDHVDITTTPSNKGSRRIAERLGFTPQPSITDGVRGLGARLTGGLVSIGNIEYDIYTLSTPNAMKPAREARKPRFFQKECTRLLSSGHFYTQSIDPNY